MAALTPGAIDQFIGKGNPLAAAGGARTLLQATGGNLAGAAFLAALARKESSFGAQAFTPNNFWGYGIHAGPSISHAPSVLAMATRVWKGLSGGLYQGSGLTTPRSIIAKYAPSSENNTGLYQNQVEEWLGGLGLAPNTNIFKGGTVPIPGGGGGGGGGGGAGAASGGLAGPLATAPTKGGGISLTPAAQRQLESYISGSRQDVLSGLTPRSVAPVLGLIGSASPAAGLMPMPGNRAPRAVGAGSSSGPFWGQQPGPGGTFGFPTGGVDTGKVFAGGVGGDWAGSMPRALALARAVGATPSSEKRSRKLTASGGVSDHWVGSTSSYATDLPTSGAAGDALFAKIRAVIGQNIRPGTWNNVNIGGYRYQIGWRVPGHYDHIHVGVRKL